MTKKKLKVVAMNHGGGMDFEVGRATYTIAFHTSSFEDGTYGGEPGGWGGAFTSSPSDAASIGTESSSRTS